MLYCLHHSHSDLLDQLESKNKTMFVSVDYFFPTRIPDYADESVSVENLEIKVKEDILNLTKKYDYVVLIDQFDDRNLTNVHSKECLKSSSAKGFSNILNFLTNTPLKRQKRDMINRVLYESMEKFVSLHVVSFTSWAGPLLSNCQFTIKNGSKRSLLELFAKEDFLVHLNDAGQATIFNTIMQQIQLLEDFKQIVYTPMPVENKIDNDFAEEIISYLSRSAEDFRLRKSGRYLTVGNPSDLYSSSAKLHGSNFTSKVAKAGLEELKVILQAVDDVARNVTDTPLVPIYLKQENQKNTLSIDLTKTLSYTIFSLDEVESDHFTSFGFDYWMGVFLTLKIRYVPVTYYFFDVELKKSGLNIHWYVIPPFEENGKIVYPPRERSPIVGSEKIRKKILQTVKHEINHPYLKYTLGASIRDPRKK